MAWTAKEDRHLSKYYRQHNARWCAARLPGHSLASVQKRASWLGLTARRPLHRWGSGEERLLARRYPLEGAAGLAASMNRSRKAIKCKAARMALRYQA